MEDSTGRDGPARGGFERPSASGDPAIPVSGVRTDGGLAPHQAFQTLASEDRVAVLVRLLSAERSGEDPLSFSELQRATDADTSAGFAYHLRQLSGHFVREDEDGYVLTPAGRRAAHAIVAGTFTDDEDRPRAS